MGLDMLLMLLIKIIRLPVCVKVLCQDIRILCSSTVLALG
jgi:hypothetical protein